MSTIRLDTLSTSDVQNYLDYYRNEYNTLYAEYKRDEHNMDDKTARNYVSALRELETYFVECNKELDYRASNTPVTGLGQRGFNGSSTLQNNMGYGGGNGYLPQTSYMSGDSGGRKNMFGATKAPPTKVYNEQPYTSQLDSRSVPATSVPPTQVPTVPDGYYPITDLNKLPFVNRTGNTVEWGINDGRANPIEPHRIVKKHNVCSTLNEVVTGTVTFVAISNKVVIPKVLDMNSCNNMFSFITDNSEDAEDKFKKIDLMYEKDKDLAIGLLNFLTLEVNRNGPCDGGWWVQDNVPISVVDGIYSLMMGSSGSDGVFKLADSDNNRSFRSNYTKLIGNVTKRLNDIDYTVENDTVTLSNVLPVVAIDSIAKLFGSRQLNDGKTITVLYNGYDVATVKDEYFSRLWDLLNSVHTKISNGIYGVDSNIKYYNMFYIVDSGDPHGKKWKAIVKSDEILIMRE